MSSFHIIFKRGGENMENLGSCEIDKHGNMRVRVGDTWYKDASDVRVRYRIEVSDSTFEIVMDLFESKVHELPPEAVEFERKRGFWILDKYRERGARIHRLNEHIGEWVDVSDRWGVKEVPRSKKTSGSFKKNNDWINKNAEQYRGKWVALYDGNLLNNADSLKDLRESMKEYLETSGETYLAFHFGEWFFGGAWIKKETHERI
jgi:hypothetical protein